MIEMIAERISLVCNWKKIKTLTNYLMIDLFFFYIYKSVQASRGSYTFFLAEYVC